VSTRHEKKPSPGAAERLPLWHLLRKQPMQSRSRAVVSALVEAFDELLRRSPNEDSVTLEALVTRAGVGIGSFYEYFSNKDALVGVLVGKATVDNFEQLLARIDADPSSDLEGKLRVMARAAVETYVKHPARTRMLLIGIARLGLMPLVTRERDRFAAEVATRLVPFVPEVPLASLERTVIVACDACMGLATAELYRDHPSPETAVEREMFEVSMGLLRVRHGIG
jgi:AcrR family transcriptional regulator